MIHILPILMAFLQGNKKMNYLVPKWKTVENLGELDLNHIYSLTRNMILWKL